MSKRVINPIFVYFWRKRKINFIALFLISVSLTLFVFLVMDKYYTATTSIIPSSSNFASTLSGKLGVLAGITGIGNLENSGQSQVMYEGIIHSRRLQSKLLNSDFTFKEKDKIISGKLIDLLEISGTNERKIFEDAYKMLDQKIIHTEINGVNYILYVSITSKNPFLSAMIANKLVKYLDEIIQTQINKEYIEQYDYLKNRISVIEDSIKAVESEHKVFLENTKDINSPENIIREMRIRRNLMVQSTIFAELKKQQELFILENMANLSPVKILDLAAPPYYKSRPKRILVLISLLIIFAFAQVALNAAIVIYRRFRKNVIDRIDS